jgi:hypothetical protein
VKANPLHKFIGIAIIGAAIAGTAVAGPSGGYTLSSLLGFGAGCPMRTPEAKLLFVDTPKNTGLSQIVTGHSYKGCIDKKRQDDGVPRLQPHVPSDDQELISAKVSGGGNRTFCFTN